MEMTHVASLQSVPPLHMEFGGLPYEDAGRRAKEGREKVLGRGSIGRQRPSH